jgi:hypothetical protein
MEKVKLFTTEDGIDIYKGDKYYTVNVVEHKVREDIRNFFMRWFKHEVPETHPAGTIAGPYINPKWNEPGGTLKYFGKRSNAEKFVAENLQN